MSTVTLRMKKISKGHRFSLFLDIYPPIYDKATRKYKRKFYLELYLTVDPKTVLEKKINKETLILAEHIRAKRLLDLQNLRYSYISEDRMKENFIDFFQEEANKRAGNYNWKMSLAYFRTFIGDTLPFIDLNETLCEEFADYLLSGPGIGRAKRSIKKNTASAYFHRFKRVLKEAFKKKLICTDLCAIVENISPNIPHREFLLLNELQDMANAHCNSELIKRAGLFSAMTGFRYSDVEALKWSQIRGIPGDYYILYNQQKTESAEYYPISDQTVTLLGQRKDLDENVFAGLKYDHVTKELPKWLKIAGINRRFTFHGFRHTFATLQIAAGTGIYTVSKLLGHKNITTTEIYARIVDSLKKEASGKIKLDTYNIGLTMDTVGNWDNSGKNQNFASEISEINIVMS
ncbi:integrase [Chryseobacterium vietnamense]|uniref:Integrase n=1 Tax=Chryseobacterium vietnamense TaxID=866785 RepID=A0ACC6JCD5_9FLAO|nr:site-specific integrase [Chryseobacterium vietnamense]MDR6460447.1 integrase [Chryseobacterium vietnamense]